MNHCSPASVRSPRGMESRVCSFYINACPSPGSIENEGSETARRLPMQKLLTCIQGLNLEGNWWLGTTTCGLVLSFSRIEEAYNLFENVDIANVLDGPVQVAYIPTKILKISPSPLSRPILPIYLTIRDVPWSVPVDDIQTALEMQGITVVNMERFRQNVRIEVNNIHCSDYLLSEGMDFFGVGKFPVIMDRSASLSDHHQSDHDVLQCYRCQGFWHVAANCRQTPRCVRCGDTHSVEYCSRPRNNPLCCNCSGPHHAAFKGCPVRDQSRGSAPVAFTLSSKRPLCSQAPVTPVLFHSKPRSLL